MTKKIYGVYFAYDASDFFPKEIVDTLNTNYPSGLARIHKYASKGDQLYAYANTRCPASQLVTADSEKEFNEKIEKLKDNFNNPEWVSKCIDPYV